MFPIRFEDDPNENYDVVVLAGKKIVGYLGYHYFQVDMERSALDHAWVYWDAATGEGTVYDEDLDTTKLQVRKDLSAQWAAKAADASDYRS